MRVERLAFIEQLAEQEANERDGYTDILALAVKELLEERRYLWEALQELSLAQIEAA
jgi:hypothetical protein